MVLVETSLSHGVPAAGRLGLKTHVAPGRQGEWDVSVEHGDTAATKAVSSFLFVELLLVPEGAAFFINVLDVSLM